MQKVVKNDELIKQFIRYLFEEIPKVKGKPQRLQTILEDTIKYIPEVNSEIQMYIMVYPFLLYNYEI